MKYLGLSEAEVELSRKEHGSNIITKLPKPTFMDRVKDSFKEKLTIILLCCLAINIAMVFVGTVHWYEPLILGIIILIATLSGVISEYKNELKFEQLEDDASKINYKVYRFGKLLEIPQEEIVVGDLIFLQSGEQIPVDAILVEGSLRVDQASLNGESLEATKLPVGDEEIGDTKVFLNKYYVYKSTLVASGEAVVKAMVVGDSTIYGEMCKEMQQERRDSPLKVRLSKLAHYISLGGYIGAVGIGLTFLLKGVYLATGFSPENMALLFKDVPALIILLTDTVMLSATIIVMAVPEGLPMMISMVLSLNMKKMIADNVLVRERDAMDTAGSVSLVISDKTGTFTSGKLDMTELVDGDLNKYGKLTDLSPELLDNFLMGIGVNNSAQVQDGEIFGQNSTDIALMRHILDCKVENEIEGVTVTAKIPFDPAVKYASVTAEIDGAQFKYVKGAPEMVLPKCSRYITSNGNVKEIDREALDEYMDAQSARCMRLIAVAVTPVVEGTELPQDMVLVGLLSLRDNLRPEVKKAVEQIKNANVQVVMATGDRKETAVAIAIECGLFDPEVHVAITSTELADMTDERVKEILPNLRVLARAIPTDKSRLCRIAQECSHVVGMVGDGANDAPALKASDVSFSMGDGSEVAKQASSIVLTDNNFASVVKAILYGRTIFKSIRKFLVFQLTVNVSAVLISFVGPLTGIMEPLTVIQILAINVVMDTLAAIAFGTEPALDRYMNEKPVDREASIVSKDMVASVLTAGLFLFAFSMCILHCDIFTSYLRVESMEEIKTTMFSFFMFGIMFNGFNARTDSYNLLENIGKNKNFLLVMGGVFLMQLAMIYVFGIVFNTVPLSAETLLKVLSFAFLVIPIDMLRKIVFRR